MYTPPPPGLGPGKSFTLLQLAPQPDTRVGLYTDMEMWALHMRFISDHDLRGSEPQELLTVIETRGRSRGASEYFWP